MTATRLKIITVILFLSSQVLFFLGLDSRLSPRSTTLCVVAMISLALCMVTGVQFLRKTSPEKKKKENAADESAKDRTEDR